MNSKRIKRGKFAKISRGRCCRLIRFLDIQVDLFSTTGLTRVQRRERKVFEPRLRAWPFGGVFFEGLRDEESQLIRVFIKFGIEFQLSFSDVFDSF